MKVNAKDFFMIVLLCFVFVISMFLVLGEDTNLLSMAKKPTTCATGCSKDQCRNCKCVSANFYPCCMENTSDDTWGDVSIGWKNDLGQTVGFAGPVNVPPGGQLCAGQTPTSGTWTCEWNSNCSGCQYPCGGNVTQNFTITPTPPPTTCPGGCSAASCPSCECYSISFSPCCVTNPGPDIWGDVRVEWKNDNTGQTIGSGPSNLTPGMTLCAPGSYADGTGGFYCQYTSNCVGCQYPCGGSIDP